MVVHKETVIFSAIMPQWNLAAVAVPNGFMSLFSHVMVAIVATKMGFYSLGKVLFADLL